MNIKAFVGIVLFSFVTAELLQKKGLSYKESKGAMLIPIGIIIFLSAIMNIKIVNDGFLVNILGEKGTRAFYFIVGLVLTAVGIYKYSIFFD